MRTRVIAAGAAVALSAAATAVAQVPQHPRGNFGGGALAAPPMGLFGSGNAVVALRALPGRKLEIEATIRAGKCLGGDVTARANIAPDGSFRAKGNQTGNPAPRTAVRTTFAIAGKFESASAIDGTVSATLRQRGSGGARTCRSGIVKFGARRPSGTIGAPQAPAAARYYGTTSQQGVGPRRAIVLRVSADGLLLSRGLFAESVKCSDGRRSIGVEGPRTNLRIAVNGKVSDRERFEIDNGESTTFVDDRFTAILGTKGARGTFSLSDRTVDKQTKRTIQSCRSGRITWTASR